MSPLVRGNDDEAVGSAARNKKRNAALSCAECRRLKLRCDRKFPCSACVKRGCSQICPEGSLTTGKGNRFVLANTESLHEKINELSHRVRSLEDALSVAHRALSSDRHPLLSDELLKIKNPLEREVVAEPPKPQEEDDAIDAVGSLSISHTGRTNFYGTTANSWFLLQNEESQTPEEDELDEDSLGLPVDLPWLSHSFPFTPSLTQATADDLRIALLDALPDAANALPLVDNYFENAAWMYHPVTRAQFDQYIWMRVYPPAGVPISPDDDRDAGSYESHRLAVLYSVLAVGLLVDLSIRSHSQHASQFFQLAKAALSLDSILEEPSLQAIQALVIMAHYMFLNDVDGPRWTLMGIVVKLAQSIGLHRDSSRWHLSPEDTQRRRELFWEIYVYDSWQSLTYGRPPSLAMAHIDCKMAHETTKNAGGQIEMSFDAWKHRFSSECLSIVHDQVFGARTPSYATIMELDKRVLSYYVPPSLQVPGFGGSIFNANGSVEQPSMRLTMQRHIILAIKEVTLLYMHRGYFAKAMSDYPDDPLSGKYGRSVLCAHRSASSFIALVKSLWSQQRAITERNWFLFTHVFSCAIVLGSIPTKCPAMGLARSALQSLDQAFDLFQQVEERARAGKVLPILVKLRERAHAVMEEYQSIVRDAANGTKREPSENPSLVHHEDELAKLGGKTRLVSPKSHSPASSRGSRSPMSSPLQTFNSPPPQTPVAPPAIYTETMNAYSSSGSDASPTYYQHSPEMTLYGTMHLPPSNGQSQMETQTQVHWQPDAALALGYMQMPMQTDVNQSMMGIQGAGIGDAGQYAMGGYDYMSALGTAYATAPTYVPNSQDILSPTQGVDPDSAWRNWMAQFSA